MKTTPTSPPRPSPLRRGVQAARSAGGSRTGRAGSGRTRRRARRPPKLSQGLFASFGRAVAERKNEQSTPTAVNTPMIARQYVIASAGRLPVLLLPLLDEEVDRDRHHRPDARHHQREQAAEGRGDHQRDRSPAAPACRDLAHDLRRRLWLSRRGGGLAAWQEPPVERRRARERRSRALVPAGAGRGSAAGRTVSATSGKVHRPGSCNSSRRRSGSTPGSAASSCPASRPRAPRGDAPGHLVLVELDEVEVGERRLLLADRRAWRPSSRRRWSARRCRRSRTSVFRGPVALLFLGVRVDVPAGLELGRDLVRRPYRPAWPRSGVTEAVNTTSFGFVRALLSFLAGAGAWAAARRRRRSARRAWPRAARRPGPASEAACERVGRSLGMASGPVRSRPAGRRDRAG